MKPKCKGNVGRMKNREATNVLTVADMWRSLLRLSAKIMLMHFSQTVYQFTDAFQTSCLGKNAVAVCSPITMFLVPLEADCFSRHYPCCPVGQKDQTSINIYSAQTLMLAGSFVALFDLMQQ